MENLEADLRLVEKNGLEMLGVLALDLCKVIRCTRSASINGNFTYDLCKKNILPAGAKKRFPTSIPITITR
jgi:hypothetical protein